MANRDIAATGTTNVATLAALQAVLYATLTAYKEYFVVASQKTYKWVADAVFGAIRPTDALSITGVTFTNATDVVNKTAHGFVNGNAAYFPRTSNLALATGLSYNTVYYVVGATANTFQVSLTLGGAAINFTSDGGTIAVTADNTTDLLTAAAHGLKDDDQVFLTATAFPTGLAAATIYYVKRISANTFQLAATAGGAAINFTTDGTAVVVNGAFAANQAGWYVAADNQDEYVIDALPEVITRVDDLNIRVSNKVFAAGNITLPAPSTCKDMRISFYNGSAFSATFVASDASTVQDYEASDASTFPADTSGNLSSNGVNWIVA